MSVITATVRGIALRHTLGDADAFGWRWWRRSMADLGYRDERCISLGYIDLRPLDIDGNWLLVAMERDASLDLVGPFDLFPIVDDATAIKGAAAFAATVLQAHVEQPVLL
jgi:hypothetical protein